VEKKKIEDLSNLVFGLALTLGAIKLTIPGDDSLASLFDTIIQFGLSFAIIIWIWWVYNNLVTEQDLNRKGMVMLNIVLLFLVVIEPFLLTVSSTYASARIAYSIDLGLALSILAVFSNAAISDSHMTPTELHRRKLLSYRNVTLLCAALFFVSLVPQLILGSDGNSIQSLMWLSALFIGVIGRLLHSMGRSEPVASEINEK
jgi:uncharacterized membrane protein